MKTAAMAKMAPEASVDAGPDCCQDMGAPSDHGKPCKPGQECKTASLLQVLTMKPPATLASTIMVSFSSDTPLTQAPSGVWRPPRV